MTDTSTDNAISTINLVRSSNPWTQADSAAGFVLRYLVPMRRQLIDILGTPAAADQSLKILLGHLVSVGFGDQRKGRLRDYLIRAVRSAAKAGVAEIPEAQRPELKLDHVTLESKAWLGYWRDGLLERAWRSLERHEHAKPDQPVYSVLAAATAAPDSNAEMIAVAIRDAAAGSAETLAAINGRVVEKTLPAARAMFAQLIADEVAETLEAPDREGVKREILKLGLAKAFEGIAI